jgi:ATP adenylyltransferase
MQHLWTPWRSTYINGKKELPNCIFCSAAASTADAENQVVCRGKHAFVMLNRYPYTAGHVMIAPYEHVSRLSQASEAAGDEIMRLARRAEVILCDIYRPDGLNMGMNLGEAAGAGVAQHIHLHVLPRWIGDANFMTTVSDTRVLPEDLDQTYAKLSHAFAKS